MTVSKCLGYFGSGPWRFGDITLGDFLAFFAESFPTGVLNFIPASKARSRYDLRGLDLLSSVIHLKAEEYFCALSAGVSGVITGVLTRLRETFVTGAMGMGSLAGSIPFETRRFCRSSTW